MQEAMKKGEYNPFRVNYLVEEEQSLKKIPKLGETIPYLKYISEKFNFEPVVVYIPSRNQVTNYYFPYEKELCLPSINDSIDLTKPEYQVHQQFLKDQCKEYGIKFIDLTETIKEKESAGNHLYWNYDEHMRAKGYKLVGEKIWANWQGEK
jgi:hypothetical protein